VETVGRRNAAGGDQFPLVTAAVRAAQYRALGYGRIELLWERTLPSGPSCLRVRKPSPTVFETSRRGHWTSKFPHNEGTNRPKLPAPTAPNEMAATSALNENVCRSRRDVASRLVTSLRKPGPCLDTGRAGEVNPFRHAQHHYRKPMDWTERKRDVSGEISRDQCAMVM